MQGMFRFTGSFVVERMAGLGAKIRHPKVQNAIWIIPVKVDAEEMFTLPINGTSVLFWEVVDEVLSVRFVCVFDSKAFYYEAKVEGSGFMFEEAWGTSGVYVSPSFKVINEFIVCDVSCLWQSIHAFFYTSKYVAIMK